MDLGVETFSKGMFSFNAVAGTVHNIVRKEYIEISGGGTRGAIINGYGSITTKNISTENYTDIEFLVHTDDGKKLPIRVSKSNLLLAEGNQVYLIFSRKLSKPENELWVGIINHDANLYWQHNTDQLAKMAGKYNLDFWFYGLLRTWITGWVVGTIIFNNFGVGVGVGVGVAIGFLGMFLFWIVGVIRISIFEGEVREQLNEILKRAMFQLNAPITADEVM